MHRNGGGCDLAIAVVAGRIGRASALSNCQAGMPERSSDPMVAPGALAELRLDKDAEGRWMRPPAEILRRMVWTGFGPERGVRRRQGGSLGIGPVAG
jgi:hypothetical protein